MTHRTSYRRRIGRLLDTGQPPPRDLFDVEREALHVPALMPLSATDHAYFIGQADATESAAHSAVDHVIELRLECNREFLRARTAVTILARRPRELREAARAVAPTPPEAASPLTARPAASRPDRRCKPP
nr:hypothetical protein OG781_29045 [Streptomyces sp. NBC_00830]